jgi:HAD superfamily hydrolase (TIGR01509 family)
VDLYLFDFDKTLYRYDFRRRLPALAESIGASQYHLAKSWWAAGYEARAERGEWGTADEYFEQWEKVTGVALSVSQWREARLKASTPIPGSVAALKRASTLGVASVFSNNPAPFAQELPRLAPDVVAIVGENRLVSCQLGARKPEVLAYQRALEHFGVRPENVFMADDSAANVAAALEFGMHAHHFTEVRGVFQVEALKRAMEEFAGRRR